jgi:hypothetical protein
MQSQGFVDCLHDRRYCSRPFQGACNRKRHVRANQNSNEQQSYVRAGYEITDVLIRRLKLEDAPEAARIHQKAFGPSADAVPAFGPFGQWMATVAIPSDMEKQIVSTLTDKKLVKLPSAVSPLSEHYGRHTSKLLKCRPLSKLGPFSWSVKRGKCEQS